MTARLNHSIVAARCKDAAALFLTEILGLPVPVLLGPFAVVLKEARAVEAASPARNEVDET